MNIFSLLLPEVIILIAVQENTLVIDWYHFKTGLTECGNSKDSGQPEHLLQPYQKALLFPGNIESNTSLVEWLHLQGENLCEKNAFASLVNGSLLLKERICPVGANFQEGLIDSIVTRKSRKFSHFENIEEKYQVYQFPKYARLNKQENENFCPCICYYSIFVQGYSIILSSDANLSDFKRDIVHYDV